MLYEVVERDTNKVVNSWNAKNIKGSATPESIEEMRKLPDHESAYFMIEFTGLKYGLGMWEVDKYDLRIV